jgi:hypothetical protein
MLETHAEDGKSEMGITMITCNAGRSTSVRRRTHTALGTTTAAVVGVATVLAGSQIIRVTPPVSDTSPHCPCAYECVQPLANPLVANGFDPLVPYRPGIWNSGMPCGLVSS